MSAADRPTLVVTALAEELDPILEGLSPSRAMLDGRRIFLARAAGRPLVLAATGDGPRRAQLAAGRLCEVYRPDAVVGLGIAGALTPDLSPLDLVASRRLRNGSGDAPSPDPALLRRATEAGARAVTLVTVEAPVVSADARRRLAEGLGEAAAVDMESAAWARAAAASGAPFIAVRAISDAASEELPGYLADCVGEEGGIRRSAVVAQALLHPASIPVLLRLRRRVTEGAGRLADFLKNRFLAA